MTTLADMTPEERTECIGIWCYIFDFDHEPEPPVAEGIIAGYRESHGGRTLVVVDHPHPDAGRWGYELNDVSPRPDLPRAWTPDGTPPKGEWQTAKMKIIPNENAKYDPDRGVITGDAVADPDHEPRDSHDIRRWVNDWEPML